MDSKKFFGIFNLRLTALLAAAGLTLALGLGTFIVWRSIPNLQGASNYHLTTFLSPTRSMGQEIQKEHGEDAGEAGGGRSWTALNNLIRAEQFIDALDLATHLLGRSAQEKGARHPDTLAVLHQIAWILHRGGDQVDAQRVLDVLVPAREKVLGPFHLDTVESLWLKAAVIRYSGDSQESRRLLQECLNRLTRAGRGDDRLLGWIHQTLADCIRWGNLDLSIEVYRQGVAATRRAFPGASFELADRLTWLGWTLVRAGRWGDARPILQEAEAQLRAADLSEHSLMATLTALKADRAALDRRWKDAARLNQQVAAMWQKRHSQNLAGFSRRITPLDGFTGLSMALVEQGYGEEAWKAFEAGRNSLTVDFETLGQFRVLDPAGQKLYAADLQARRWALEQWDRWVANVSDPWDEEHWPWLADILALEAKLARTESEFLHRYRPPVPDPGQVAASLSPGTALVGIVEHMVGASPDYHTGDFLGKTMGFVLRSGRPLQWFSLFESRDVQNYCRLRNLMFQCLQRNYRAATWPLRVNDDPELKRQAQAWGEAVFSPLLPSLEGIGTLLIEGSTHPYDLITFPDGTHFSDRFKTVYIPAGAAWLWRGKPPKRPGPVGVESILAVSGWAGDFNLDSSPLLTSTKRSLLSRTRTSFLRKNADPLKLPSLPFAVREVKRISQIFPQSLRVPDRMSAVGFLEQTMSGGQGRQLDVLHIAGHTLGDGFPERMGLALWDGKGDPAQGGVIDIERILHGWSTEVDLVTLSGCETAKALSSGRGEVHGFVPALLGVGAGTVLSSLWPVDDEATEKWMVRFYEDVMGAYQDSRGGHPPGTPMSKAEAVSEAKHWLRNWEDAQGRRPFAHPVYWAGFILIGRP